jgi:hypothetical protein
MKGFTSDTGEARGELAGRRDSELPEQAAIESTLASSAITPAIR